MVMNFSGNSVDIIKSSLGRTEFIGDKKRKKKKITHTHTHTRASQKNENNKKRRPEAEKARRSSEGLFCSDTDTISDRLGFSSHLNAFLRVSAQRGEPLLVKLKRSGLCRFAASILVSNSAEVKRNASER